jgi:membrane protease YdiL (CAAX protease family)
MSVIHRRIVLFFLVSYALTWFGHLGNWLWPGPYWPLPMNPFGPLVAAPLVIGFTEGREGLKRWLRRVVTFRAPLRAYLAAFFIPLAIILASAGLTIAAGTPHEPLPPNTLVDFVILVPVILILAGPATEEPGFRAYGLHELQATVSPLAASLWIGVGVLIWHAPVLLLGNIDWPVAINIVAVSVVYAWLYQMGGVWPVITLHFSHNYFGGEYIGTIFSGGGSVAYTGILAAFYVVLAVGLAWWLGPELGRRQSPMRETAPPA